MRPTISKVPAAVVATISEDVMFLAGIVMTGMTLLLLLLLLGKRVTTICCMRLRADEKVEEDDDDANDDGVDDNGLLGLGTGNDGLATTPLERMRGYLLRTTEGSTGG